MTTNQSKIFITGATGDISSQVVNLLQKENVPLRVICRRQNQVDAFQKRGIDAVLGNLDDNVNDLTEHMQGCDRLLLNAAATPSLLQHNRNTIDAAMKAGVKWIVKVSAGDARDEGNTPWVRGHFAADQYLRDTATQNQIFWTILKPSGFMQNVLQSAPAIQKGFYPQTSGDGKCGWM